MKRIGQLSAIALVTAALLAMKPAPPRFVLTWTDTSNPPAASETAFLIERRPASGSYLQIASVGQNVTTFTDLNILGGGYCYRVRGQNADGYSPYSNEACDTAPYDYTVPGSGYFRFWPDTTAK